MKNPYDVIERKYVTEKSTVLEGLQNASSNKSVAKFKLPKAVFLVASDANKHEIAAALEEIYKEQKITVRKVNTIQVKEKPKRRGRGRPGAKGAFKKAIVTLEAGDSLEKV
jgi:large subunit ribosomal protein L23